MIFRQAMTLRGRTTRKALRLKKISVEAEGNLISSQR
jgi:hypothetical protein